MTRDDILVAVKSRGGILAPGINAAEIDLTNAGLGRMLAAMLPPWIRELYAIAGGIILGNAYIFGPKELANGIAHPVPSIIQINDEIRNIPGTRGITIFGRNDLFWFGFDAFGVCYMLDNTSLQKLRKYDDPIRAINDCMAVGGI